MTVMKRKDIDRIIKILELAGKYDRSGNLYSYSAEEKERLRQRREASTLKVRAKKYGMNIEELLSMPAKCCICGKECPQISLCIDHDHNTGRVRGLLCHNCNTGLGQFKENPEFLLNAVDYVFEKCWV